MYRGRTLNITEQSYAYFVINARIQPWPTSPTYTHQKEALLSPKRWDYWEDDKEFKVSGKRTKVNKPKMTTITHPSPAKWGLPFLYTLQPFSFEKHKEKAFFTFSSRGWATPGPIQLSAFSWINITSKCFFFLVVYEKKVQTNMVSTIGRKVPCCENAVTLLWT